MPALPITVFLDPPRWVRIGRRRPVLWPVGRLTIPVGPMRAKPIDAVLVVAVEADVRLRLIPPELRCVDARIGWPPAPQMGGNHQAALQHALALAAHMLVGVRNDGLECRIGYVKSGEVHAEIRRIAWLVPSPDGASIRCNDLAKQAPRTFKLSRIAWVETELPDIAPELR